MKISTIQTVNGVKTIEDMRRFVSRMLDDILSVINGRLDFLSNCKTNLVSVTFSGSGVVVQVPHTLNIVPNGYLIAGKSVSFDVFDGGTPSTTKLIYLQASAAGTAQILIF